MGGFGAGFAQPERQGVFPTETFVSREHAALVLGGAVADGGSEARRVLGIGVHVPSVLVLVETELEHFGEPLARAQPAGVVAAIRCIAGTYQAAAHVMAVLPRPVHRFVFPTSSFDPMRGVAQLLPFLFAADVDFVGGLEEAGVGGGLFDESAAIFRVVVEPVAVARSVGKKHETARFGAFPLSLMFRLESGIGAVASVNAHALQPSEVAVFLPESFVAVVEGVIVVVPEFLPVQ